MKEHYEILSAEGGWKTLCGAKPSEPQHLGILVESSEISCSVCRVRHKIGMRKVANLFENYKGEE